MTEDYWEIIYVCIDLGLTEVSEKYMTFREVSILKYSLVKLVRFWRPEATNTIFCDLLQNVECKIYFTDICTESVLTALISIFGGKLGSDLAVAQEWITSRPLAELCGFCKETGQE